MDQADTLRKLMNQRETCEESQGRTLALIGDFKNLKNQILLKNMRKELLRSNANAKTIVADVEAEIDGVYGYQGEVLRVAVIDGSVAQEEVVRLSAQLKLLRRHCGAARFGVIVNSVTERKAAQVYEDFRNSVEKCGDIELEYIGHCASKKNVEENSYETMRNPKFLLELNQDVLPDPDLKNVTRKLLKSRGEA